MSILNTIEIFCKVFTANWTNRIERDCSQAKSFFQQLKSKQSYCVEDWAFLSAVITLKRICALMQLSGVEGYFAAVLAFLVKNRDRTPANHLQRQHKIKLSKFMKARF